MGVAYPVAPTRTARRDNSLCGTWLALVGHLAPVRVPNATSGDWTALAVGFHRF